MSENFNHQVYRDDLSKNLKTARTLGEEGKELAVDLLDSSKKTDQYKQAKHEHLQENAHEEVESIKQEIGALKIETLSKSLKLNLEFTESMRLGNNRTYQESNDLLQEMNAKLQPGEKPWRMLTEGDLKKLFKPYFDIKYGKSIDDVRVLLDTIIDVLNLPQSIFWVEKESKEPAIFGVNATLGGSDKDNIKMWSKDGRPVASVFCIR